MSTKTILYATDYSEGSLHGLQFATWLAHCTGSKLLILHVCQVEQYPVGELSPDVPEVDQRELDRLNAIRPTDSTVPYEHRLLYGESGTAQITHPADIIVKLANDEHVDMIVLGTHGRTGFRRLLMGSVAESVLRHATCPVVIIRQENHVPPRVPVGETAAYASHP
jgi:nucleotide-binding universal stress UspA family protein